MCAVLSVTMQGTFSIPQFYSVADFSTIAKHKKGLGITVAGLASLVLADRALKNSLVILKSYLKNQDLNTLFEGDLVLENDWTYSDTTDTKPSIQLLVNSPIKHNVIPIRAEVPTSGFIFGSGLHPDYLSSFKKGVVVAHWMGVYNELSWIDTYELSKKRDFLYKNIVNRYFSTKYAKQELLNTKDNYIVILYELESAENNEVRKNNITIFGMVHFPMTQTQIFKGQNWWGKMLMVMRDRMILFDRSRVVRFKALLDYISSRMRRV